MGSEFGKFTLKLAEWKKENNQHSANAKAGKPFKATKKPKDEKAPKRPQSAYFLWTASRRAAVKAANPDAKVTEIAKLMGAEWKTLSEAEKKPFVAEAEKAKSAYTAAMATYKGSAGFAPRRHLCGESGNENHADREINGRGVEGAERGREEAFPGHGGQVEGGVRG